MTPRHRELDKTIAIHDNLHLDVVTCVSATSNGGFIVTGCKDSTVRVWRASKNIHSRHIHLQETLVGHESPITAIFVLSTYGLVVSGDAQGRVVVWDLKRLCFLRCLLRGNEGGDLGLRMNGVTALAGNENTGNILVLVNGEIIMYDVNGKVLARQGTGGVGSAGDNGSGGGHGSAYRTPSMKRSKSGEGMLVARDERSTGGS